MVDKMEIKLTDRERQVLVLICKEKRDIEIAKSLKISLRTVETYKKYIKKKIKPKSMIGLYKYAISQNIITENKPSKKPIELNNVDKNGKKIGVVRMFMDEGNFEYRAEYKNSTDKIKVGTFNLINGNILFEETEDSIGIPYSALKLLIKWIEKNIKSSIKKK